jgi:hypothetical protein
MHTHITNTTMRKLRGSREGSGEKIFALAINVCDIGQSNAAPFVSHH